MPAMRRLLLLVVAVPLVALQYPGGALCLSVLSQSAQPPHETEIDWRGGRKELEPGKLGWP